MISKICLQKSVFIEKVKSLSCVQLFVTPWNVPCQAPLSMGFPGKSTGVGGHFLLQGIFPTQGPNSGLSHCKQPFYHLSHQGSPTDRRNTSKKKKRKEKRRRNTSELILENNKCPPEKLYSFFRHVWGYLSLNFVWIFPFSDLSDCDIFHCI